MWGPGTWGTSKGLQNWWRINCSLTPVTPTLSRVSKEAAIKQVLELADKALPGVPWHLRNKDSGGQGRGACTVGGTGCQKLLNIKPGHLPLEHRGGTRESWEGC